MAGGAVRTERWFIDDRAYDSAHGSSAYRSICSVGSKKLTLVSVHAPSSHSFRYDSLHGLGGYAGAPGETIANWAFKRVSKEQVFGIDLFEESSTYDNCVGHAWPLAALEILFSIARLVVPLEPLTQTRIERRTSRS